MKQITEDYCSYETAVLLKEKRFDVPCDSYYAYFESNVTLYKGYLPEFSDSNINHNKYNDRTSRPSQSIALKWLREVHHYYIQIMLDSWALGDHSGYYVVIQKTDSDFEMMLQDVVDEVFYQTYEEACEAALKYTLEKLI